MRWTDVTELHDSTTCKQVVAFYKRLAVSCQTGGRKGKGRDTTRGQTGETSIASLVGFMIPLHIRYQISLLSKNNVKFSPRLSAIEIDMRLIVRFTLFLCAPNNENGFCTF